MKFCLIAQCEIAYLKDKKGEIVRKFYAPSGHLFYPGIWEFEDFPKDFFIKTCTPQELRNYLNNDGPPEDSQ